MYIKWLIFSCDLLSLYPAVHFLRMWLSGIIVVMHLPAIYFFGSLPLLIFVLLLSIPLSRFAWSTVRFGQVFYTFWDSVVSSLGGSHRKLFAVDPSHCQIFLSRFTFVEDILIYIYFFLCASASPAISFLFVGEVSATNQWVVDLLPILCRLYFSYHR